MYAFYILIAVLAVYVWIISSPHFEDWGKSIINFIKNFKE